MPDSSDPSTEDQAAPEQSRVERFARVYTQPVFMSESGLQQVCAVFLSEIGSLRVRARGSQGTSRTADNLSDALKRESFGTEFVRELWITDADSSAGIYLEGEPLGRVRADFPVSAAKLADELERQLSAHRPAYAWFAEQFPWFLLCVVGLYPHVLGSLIRGVFDAPESLKSLISSGRHAPTGGAILRGVLGGIGGIVLLIVASLPFRRLIRVPFPRLAFELPLNKGVNDWALWSRRFAIVVGVGFFIRALF